MTPLAQKIVRAQILTPAAFRPEFDDSGHILSRLDDVHHFDLFSVSEAVVALKGHLVSEQGGKLVGMNFLPAPRTWIELSFIRKDHMARPVRSAYHLEEIGDGAAATLVGPNGSIPLGHISFSDPGRVSGPDGGIPMKEALPLFCEIYACLAIINTPRTFGRKQHMPHRGLERELLREQKMIGKFPLHAWTEIKLEVFPKYKDDAGVEHEAHLTGRKCLHFCRSHLRVRNGRVELVNSHWRGDPALGMKRSRYNLVAKGERP